MSGLYICVFAWVYHTSLLLKPCRPRLVRLLSNCAGNNCLSSIMCKRWICQINNWFKTSFSLTPSVHLWHLCSLTFHSYCYPCLHHIVECFVCLAIWGCLEIRQSLEKLGQHPTVVIGYLIQSVSLVTWWKGMLCRSDRSDGLSTHDGYLYGIKIRGSRTYFGNIRSDILQAQAGKCNLKALLHLNACHFTGLYNCGVPGTVAPHLFRCFRILLLRAVLFGTLDTPSLFH